MTRNYYCEVEMKRMKRSIKKEISKSKQRKKMIIIIKLEHRELQKNIWNPISFQVTSFTESFEAFLIPDEQ